MIRVDISGPDGNAFALMAIARRLCRQLGKDFDPIQAEMMSGDYENLLSVFKREFGHVATLEGREDLEEDEFYG